ncbi:MAG: YceI family protein [Bacteroidota bacterium]
MTFLIRPLFAAALVLLISACGNVGDAPEAETTAVPDSDATEASAFVGDAWALDLEATTVAWRGAKVTGSHDGGFNEVTGNLYVADGTLSGVEVNIDTRSIFSDNEDLTEHLSSEDFFAVEAYPEAAFMATTFTALAEAPEDAPEATHTITGTLTMRGQTNEITFPATVTVSDERIVADADFIIDRTRWGIIYEGRPDDLIRDEVRLMLHAEAANPSASMTASAE